MGGYGSGRTGWKGKVESCRSLDVNRLNKEGCLRPGYRASLAWTADGEQVASIGLRATADRLILNYRVGRNGEDWTDVEEAVPLARSPCRFGGMRTYFVCPGEKNGRPCLRRVSKLYRGGQYFLCRHCYDLAYASQSEAPPLPAPCAVPTNARSPWAENPGPLSLPPKPKGMHRRTYERYLDEIDAAEEQGLLAF